MQNRNLWSFLIVAGAAAMLSGCGSSSSNPTGPYGPTPTPMTTPTPVTTPTPTTTPTPAGSAQVTISNFAFSAVTVSVGTSVTWMNMDTTAHTATADSSSAFQFDTGSIAPGATSAPVVFNTAGSFPYHCSIHPFMHGTVVVQ